MNLAENTLISKRRFNICLNFNAWNPKKYQLDFYKKQQRFPYLEINLKVPTQKFPT